jgi:ATP-binding cassette subfamily B protein
MTSPSDERDAHPLKRLLTYATPHRGQIAQATTFSILNKLFDLAPPALIGAAVNIVVKREDSLFAQWGLSDVTHQLIALAAVTVLIWALESLFEYLLELRWRDLAQTLQHELRLDVYRHAQNLELATFFEQGTGQLMSVLNDDINQLERFLDQGANDLIQVLTTAIVITAAFFYLAPSVAWMAMLPVPFVLWGSFKFQTLLTERYAQVRASVGALNGQLSNNLSGIATIKSFTTEAYEAQRIASLSDAYRRSNYGAIRLSSAFSPLIRMVIVVGFTATLVWGGLLAVRGELDVGAYSVLVFLTQRLLWPLTRLGKTFDLYQRAMASTKRALDLLHTPVTIRSGAKRLDRAQVKGEILFQSVDFSYPGREALFKGLTLRIEAGSTVGIVGTTGSGKSTLINLLLRFYEPSAGEVLLDGRRIDSLELDDLRGAIGLVSQNPFLFAGTIEQNLVYGSFGATEAQVEEAACAAEAHEFIEALEDGVQTQVGERGEGLSGGQRQRISIARALLKAPPVLVLDEATSAVDNETEAALQRSLQKICEGRTTLIIAHRLSTIRRADRILVMERGAIIEDGTHDELLERGGHYAHLWAIQTAQGSVA